MESVTKSYHFYCCNSNRQKSSGAEGERLKEAANINKSLSTLGYCWFKFCQNSTFSVFVSFLSC